ncbi:general transcription factor 3C polypeptide 6-like [Liolophura sinensis]|uniref:general transcription factor 3C polypeptide 6-like n=1 Tax=Liolophura sinensis TaxID=3198878 RepID=UPI00315913C5
MAGGKDDDEWEEEESLVLVELSGVIDHDMITSSDPSKCNILGADTDSPLLQLDRCVFVGEYQEAVGTLLLFEETSDSQLSSSGEAKALKYAGKTVKQLSMKRAFVSEKGDLQFDEENLSFENQSSSGISLGEDESQISSTSQPEKGTVVKEQTGAMDLPP